MYFGLWKTDKTGLYAIGKAGARLPTALILSRRFDTSSYALHKPQAANAFGPNFFCAFDDNGSADFARIENNNSHTRSSNATDESILIDAGDSYASKSWMGFLLKTKSMPDDCSIKIDVNIDNDSAFDTGNTDTITNADDQQSDGETADRFWHREWSHAIGRMIQIRIRFTSSTTSKAQLYSIGLLSQEQSLI